MILLDTSGLFCLLDADDERYAVAREFYAADAQRLTHDYVLAEFVPLCRTRKLEPMSAIAFVVDLLDSREVEVIWVNEVLHRQGLELLQARPDKAYSLCDSVSFLLMRQRGLTEALTTDRHFEQEGFVRLLKP